MNEFDSITYGANLSTAIHTRRTETDTLELMVDVGDSDLTVALNLYHVKELRKVLQRYEALLKTEGIVR